MPAPTLIQEWNGGAVATFDRNDEVPYPVPPRLGMVIGTFAAAPYIHLQLEARRRFYPVIPLLIHDDGSHKVGELRDLCREYGADFEWNAVRQPPCVGDLTAFVGGLWWARRKGIDLLLKASRRWLFLTDWTASLTALALESQYATFSSYTTTFDFGFRSECVGLDARTWAQPQFLAAALETIRQGRSVFVEAFLHDFARQFERQNCRQAESWRQAHPSPPDRNGYALWTFMGTDRCARSAGFLWHDAAKPEDYFHLARDWNLPYRIDDFQDPNQGCGLC